jgi:hypothetical protein
VYQASRADGILEDPQARVLAEARAAEAAAALLEEEERAEAAKAAGKKKKKKKGKKTGGASTASVPPPEQGASSRLVPPVTPDDTQVRNTLVASSCHAVGGIAIVSSFCVSLSPPPPEVAQTCLTYQDSMVHVSSRS